jgi:hypothetical protein
VWRAVGRIIVIPLAFLVAAVAAAFIVATLGLEQLTRALHSTTDESDRVASMLDVVWQGTLIASGATIIPALAVVIIGEVARIRSWLYYMVGGGAALAAIPLLARLQSTDPAALPPAIVWQVFATAGFAAGLVYWLLAGRNA